MAKRFDSNAGNDNYESHRYLESDRSDQNRSDRSFGANSFRDSLNSSIRSKNVSGKELDDSKCFN